MCIISACKSKLCIHGTKADMFPISALFSAQYREGRGRKEGRRREDEKTGERRQKEKVVSNPGSWVSRRPCPPLYLRVVSCLFRRAVADEEIPRALTSTPRPTDGGERSRRGATACRNADGCNSILRKPLTAPSFHVATRRRHVQGAW